MTKEGVHQGEALSHVFLTMFMEDVAKEIKSKIEQTHVGYKRLETVSIEECLFAKNRSELKYNLMLWKEALKERNMNINMKKNENYDIRKRGKCRNGSGGHQIRTSEEIKFLGVQI